MGVKKPAAKPEKPAKAKYGPEQAFEVQGMPVSLATCLECGAAVFGDARDLHAESHA